MSRETRARGTTALRQRLTKALLCCCNKSQDEADDPGSSLPPSSSIPSDSRYVPISVVMPPRYRLPSPPPSPPPSYEEYYSPAYDAVVPQRLARRIESKNLPPRKIQRPTAPSAAVGAGRAAGPAVNRRPKAKPLASSSNTIRLAPSAVSSITPKPTTSSPLAATVIVTEVIDAAFKQGGKASRVDRRGYLSLYFQASVIDVLSREPVEGSLKLVLSDAAAVDCTRSARNVQLRSELHESPTQKIFVVHHRDLVAHLRQLHKDDPSADYYRATVAKYRIRTTSLWYPLTLSALWVKESATLLSLQLYYEPKASTVDPSTPPLEAVEFTAKVPSTWRLSSSYPSATEVTDGGVSWSVGKLERRRNVLAAKFQIDSSYAGEYKAEVSASFRCSGATLSGVKLEMVHAVNVWPIRDVRMKLESGHYYCS